MGGVGRLPEFTLSLLNWFLPPTLLCCNYSSIFLLSTRYTHVRFRSFVSGRKFHFTFPFSATTFIGKNSMNAILHSNPLPPRRHFCASLHRGIVLFCAGIVLSSNSMLSLQSTYIPKNKKEIEREKAESQKERKKNLIVGHLLRNDYKVFVQVRQARKKRHCRIDRSI